MKKTKASPYGETPEPKGILPFFSDNSPISEDEWLRVRLVALTKPRIQEPSQLRADRNRIESARKTYEHFQGIGLSPIFNSFEYEALSLIGVA
jgi:hypothetical protein